MASKEVLFIHHRISLSDVIQAGFEDIGDWNISKANTFQSSLIKILINPPDLIILEFEFPEINGVEILKAIRNYVCCYAPAVVFISKPITAEKESILTELGVVEIIYQPPSQFFPISDAAPNC